MQNPTIIITRGKSDILVGLASKRDNNLVEPGRPTFGTDGILTNTLGGHLGFDHLNCNWLIVTQFNKSSYKFEFHNRNVKMHDIDGKII